MILPSLRKPMRISAICSNGKTYSFLVKYGEDLRKDERIQQIQQLMSDQMKCDPNCSQHKLSLRTYKVIPLSVRHGIISWIENTDSIKSFISDNVDGWCDKEKNALNQYRNFIETCRVKETKYKKFFAAAMQQTDKETRNEVCVIVRFEFNT